MHHRNRSIRTSVYTILVSSEGLGLHNLLLLRGFEPSTSCMPGKCRTTRPRLHSRDDKELICWFFTQSFPITKAQLSLTYSLAHSVVPCPQSKAFSAKKNWLALDKLQSCFGGRVVKTMDIRSDRGSACMFHLRYYPVWGEYQIQSMCVSVFLAIPDW